MSDTKEFHVVQIARSDGADTGPGYWPSAAPTAAASPAAGVAGAKRTAARDAKDAPEKATRTKAPMVRLDENDARFVEWRIKLGILLKQELSPTPDEGLPWYVQFPRGYWLYEKSKHLWVSGYPIKPKLFKTPQEFALHLIWLTTESANYSDCCCIHCNLGVVGARAGDNLVIAPPVAKDGLDTPTPPLAGFESGKPPSKAAKKTPETSSQQKFPAPSPASQAIAASPLVQSKPPTPINAPTQGPMGTPTPAPTQPRTAVSAGAGPVSTPAPATAATPMPTPPAPAPQPAPAQQQAKPTPPSHLLPWPMPSDLLFRVGEIVWFQNFQSWRIGLISTLSRNPRHPNFPTFELIPLGHRAVPQSNVQKMPQEMRPFHAFTVPPATMAEVKDKVFDSVPWDSYFQTVSADPDTKRRDVLLLDASKLAATKINYSHSFFTALDDGLQATSRYGGLFLGPERIEIGDALRVQRAVNPNTDNPGDSAANIIFGVREILTSTGIPGATFLRGSEYRLIRLPPGTNTASIPIVPPEHLPLALREEIVWRSSLRPAQGPAAADVWAWLLVQPEAVHREQSVRGRYYPTHRLMPVTKPEAFNGAMQTGLVDDSGTYLNSRMDGMGAQYMGRKANRADTVGLAIPIDRGIAFEPHVREGIAGM